MKVRPLLLTTAAIALLVPTVLFTVRATSALAPVPVAQNCTLQVPADRFSPAGLATPYQLGGAGCDEANLNTSAFVQATIISPTGQVSVYSPLVVNAGQTPPAAPVVPVITPGSTVGIFFGFNGVDLHLTGKVEGCINGTSVLFGSGGTPSDFGQFAYCGAERLYDAMSAAVAAGTLVVPPLGTTALGATCPTVASFQVADQDPHDNVQTSYLTGADNFAQNTAANRALFPAATVLSNPSDNGLLTKFIDPALGCHPWVAPDLADPGATVASMALDEFQATQLQAAPFAYVPLIDEMTLNGANQISGHKTALYRLGVDQPLFGNGSEQYYCTNLAHVFPPFLTANAAALKAAPSPFPLLANNLYSFLAQRFVATYEMGLPSPGVIPTCDTTIGVPNPVSLITQVVGADVVIVP